MVTKKDLVIAILCTFCLTVSLFMIIPTRSSPDIGEYSPWIDVNDDGVIDISDLVIMVGSIPSAGNPTKNVNVTNWPEDRPLNVKKGIERIIIIDTFSQGLEMNPTENEYFYFNFEPKGFLINVTEIYVNMIYSNCIYTTDADVHLAIPALSIIDHPTDYKSTWIYLPLISIPRSNCYTTATYGHFGYPGAFNFTYTQVGMNELAIYSNRPNDSRVLLIYLLELFVEYNYLG